MAVRKRLIILHILIERRALLKRRCEHTHVRYKSLTYVPMCLRSSLIFFLSPFFIISFFLAPFITSEALHSAWLSREAYSNTAMTNKLIINQSILLNVNQSIYHSIHDSINLSVNWSKLTTLTKIAITISRNRIHTFSVQGLFARLHCRRCLCLWQTFPG